MRYDEEQNRIFISCRELVSAARRGIAAMPKDTDEPEMREFAAEEYKSAKAQIATLEVIHF